MKLLIVDGPGLHPSTGARALGAAFHRLGHDALVHPLGLHPQTWLHRHALGREARKILDSHLPDVVHVIGSDPFVAEAFAGHGVTVVHATLEKPSRVDWVIAPTRAGLTRIAGALPGGDSRAGYLPYAVEIGDDEPGVGSFVLAVVGSRDRKARRWVEEAAAALPHLPVRWEGDPSEARFVISMASRPESWPRGVAEAMAAGRAVVAGWSGAAPEFVLEGVTGFLSAPGDVRSLVSHMAQLWDQPEEAILMGLAGRAEARGHFGAEGQARTLLQWYRRAGVPRLAV
jgi:hypothetical protein